MAKKERKKEKKVICKNSSFNDVSIIVNSNYLRSYLTSMEESLDHKDSPKP